MIGFYAARIDDRTEKLSRSVFMPPA